MLNLIDEVSNIEDGQKPDPEKRIGRKCYAFSPTEDKAFTLIEDKARELFAECKLSPEDYEIKTDGIGNLFITYFGKERNLTVMSGSHADSVLNGGKYDGMAGVNSAYNFLSGLAKEEKKPQKSFTMVVFRAEESSPKTGVACLGSRVATGTITPEDLEKIKYRMDDGSSISLHQYFDQHYGPEKWNAVLEEIKNPPINSKNTVAYEELHIEQSGVIETNKADVGIVVEGIGGAIRETVSVPIKPEMIHKSEITRDEPHFRLKFSFKGEEAHTGGTPPNPKLKKTNTDIWYRKDALFAASEFARLFFRLAGRAGLEDKIKLTDFSMPEERGFTTVPPDQDLELILPVSAKKAVRQIAEQCITRISDNTGVRISAEDTPVEIGEITHYDHLILKSLQIPVAVERIARRAVAEQTKESGGVGNIRVTVTDFHIATKQEQEGSLQHAVEKSIDFKLDFRNVNTEAIEAASEKIRNRINGVFPDVKPQIKTIAKKNYAPLDKDAVRTKRELAKKLGQKTVEMPSLPGQDAENLSKIGIPTSMTFIGHNGKSHNPEENVGPAEYASAEKLSHAYLRKMVGLEE